jgi:hypothetical protein
MSDSDKTTVVEAEHFGGSSRERYKNVEGNGIGGF